MTPDEQLESESQPTTATCLCGHGREEHWEEPPYTCFECECDGFTYPTASDILSAERPEEI